MMLAASLMMAVQVARADEKLKACDEALGACNVYVDRLKEQVKRQDEYIVVIEKQRNEALKQVAEDGGKYPFYFWLIIGAAAGVVLSGSK